MNLAKQLDTSQYSEIKGIPVHQQRNCSNRNQEKNPIRYSNKKNKGPRNIPNQGGKRPVLRKLHTTEERNSGRHKQMEACTMFMDWKN